jgi:hypothetical protein
LRAAVARWPYAIHEEFDGLRVAFAHYGLGEAGQCCAPFVRDPTPSDLDRLFAPFSPTAVVFYGHDHTPADRVGSARYVNPGALGCGPEPVARFAILAVGVDGRYQIATHAVSYDQADLIRQFEERDVPERAFILKAFFGRGQGRP